MDKQEKQRKAAYMKIMEATKELTKLIWKYKEKDVFVHGAVHDAIFEITNWGSDNHFEALGLLTEVMLSYRDRAKEVFEEEQLEKAQETAD